MGGTALALPVFWLTSRRGSGGRKPCFKSGLRVPGGGAQSYAFSLCSGIREGDTETFFSLCSGIREGDTETCFQPVLSDTGGGHRDMLSVCAEDN